jgi:hypothetical protein
MSIIINFSLGGKQIKTHTIGHHISTMSDTLHEDLKVTPLFFMFSGILYILEYFFLYMIEILI